MSSQIHYCESGAELCQMLEKIHKPAVPNLHAGYAATIQDLWQNVIKPMLPSKEVALAWHKSLMEYVQRPDAFYVLRGYSSVKALRRGFLSRTDQGYSFVYSDNDHAFYYAKMAMEGIVASPDALVAAYQSGKFPLKFTPFTKEEKGIAFLKYGRNPGMSLAGYKLSHIHGLGDRYQGGVERMADLLARFYNGGNVDDWNRIFRGPARYERSFAVKEPDVAKKYITAAFLRLVHPFNYFFTPSIKRQLPGTVRFYRADVGEYRPLIDFVWDEFRKMYGPAYDAFEQAVMPEHAQRPVGDTEIDLRYSEVKIVKSKQEQPGPEAWTPQRSFVNPYPELKVGRIADTVLRGVLESGCVPEEEVEALTQMESSSEVFSLSSYPLLSDVREGPVAVRYYATPLNINGKTYYMSSQWTTRQSAPLLKWLDQYPAQAAEAYQQVDARPAEVREVPDARCRRIADGSYPWEDFEAFLMEQNLSAKTVSDYVYEADMEIKAMIANGEPMETVADLRSHLDHLYKGNYASAWRKYIAFVAEWGEQ